MRTLLLALTLSVCGSFAAMAGTICPAGNGANPFPHSPDNAATGCNVIITINANGSVTVTEPDATAYETSEDVLVGVVNNTGAPLSSLTITGGAGNDIFGFDGDGICVYTFVGSSYCTTAQMNGTDPGDYQGPTSTFSMISADHNTGTVNFSTPISAGGGTTYFSLEGAPTSALTVVVGTSSTDPFQIRYAANLNIGDAYVDITNSGATVANGTSQNLCANLYTFDPAEELISCCTCSITPNGLQSLSVIKSLISNPLTPAVPTSVVIKVVATSDPVCNAATAATQAHGLLVWGTSLHQNSSGVPASYSVTEGAFSFATLSVPELAHITSTCGFIQGNGSGFGICKGCAAGGLGASSNTQ
jgi:hypothetical protein